MKKRSKVISILLATAMAGSMLAGCGGNDSKSEGNDSKQTSESKEEEKENYAISRGFRQRAGL